MDKALEPAFSIVDSSDLDDYRAQPGNWNVQVNQLDKGNFRSVIRCIELPGLKVYDNRWDAGCQALGQSPDDWLMLGNMVSHVGPRAYWCGNRLEETVFACTSPGKEMEFTIGQQAHDVIILIRPGLMQQTCGSEAVEFVKAQQSLCFDVLSGSALVELILDLLRRCEKQPQLLQTPAIAARVRSNLLRALEKCFAGFFQQNESTPSIREAAFHAAVLHVKQALQNTSAWHMAQAAGVSQKTLEVAFRECIGMTPGRYLALTRLNSAHHQLALGGADELRVLDVSTQWGFSHVGRFSAAYRQLFGELPSKTLRRSSRQV